MSSWDSLIIGSGPGGLTAALALARAGQKVMVLEQHYLPGGWAHSFSLGGHRFSPGVHYLGGLQPGGPLRRLYEGLGLDLEFSEMSPDGFDHFHIAGSRFDQPKGEARWIARLVDRFPKEETGIRRFFSVLSRLAGDLKRVDENLGFPRVLVLPFKAPALARWGFSTLKSLLDATITDPMLRAVLSAQVGNHGSAPSKVSLAVHASMTAHYFDGAYYPRGGAKKIPAAFLRALRKAGGEIRLRTEVKRIIVDGHQATGVELASGEILTAGNVICNADPAITFGKLLPAELCKSSVRKVARTRYSISSISLFCGVKMDLSAYDSGNYWHYASTDIDGIYKRAGQALPTGDLEALFLAITSLKDPGHGPAGTHTLEMFTFAPHDAFAEWEDSTVGDRSAEYDALKRSLGDRMIDAAEKIIPGLRKHITFQSMATPLTNDHYCRSYKGAMYGSAKTPGQVGPFAFSQQGPVGGLWMCGASTLAHGIAGASYSGLIAASRVLGRSTPEECLDDGSGTVQVSLADVETLLAA